MVKEEGEAGKCQSSWDNVQFENNHISVIMTLINIFNFL